MFDITTLNLPDVFLAFFIVGFMELGDKTQLTAIAIATRYRDAKKVSIGVSLGLSTITIIGVLAGAVMKELIPYDLLQLIICLLFISLGIWILIETYNGEEEVEELLECIHCVECRENGKTCPHNLYDCQRYIRDVVSKGAIRNSFFLIFIAELGDKTMFSAFGLATQLDPVQTFFGSALALIFVNIIGVYVGIKIAEKIPRRTISYIVGVLFTLIGLIMVLSVINGR